MEIKVLGTGCAKCKALYTLASQAITRSGVPATLTKVEQLDEIMAFGVMMTPALVVAGEVRCSGRLPSVAEVTTWITTAASTEAR